MCTVVLTGSKHFLTLLITFWAYLWHIQNFVFFQNFDFEKKSLQKCHFFQHFFGFFFSITNLTPKMGAFAVPLGDQILKGYLETQPGKLFFKHSKIPRLMFFFVKS